MTRKETIKKFLLQPLNDRNYRTTPKSTVLSRSFPQNDSKKINPTISLTFSGFLRTELNSNYFHTTFHILYGALYVEKSNVETSVWDVSIQKRRNVQFHTKHIRSGSRQGKCTQMHISASICTSAKFAKFLRPTEATKHITQCNPFLLLTFGYARAYITFYI